MAAFVIILVLSAICAAMAMFLFGRPEHGKTPGTGLQAHQVQEVAESITLFVKELQAASAAVAARLDERERALTALLARADRVCNDLRHVLQDARLEDPAGRGTPESAGHDPHSSEIEHRYNRVFQLHDQGLSLNEISEQLGMGKGQLQLIFNLRRKA